MNRDTYDMLARLERLGISRDDAASLRRISMTLHRWHELECGSGNGAIERDETSGKPFMVHQVYDKHCKQVRYQVADKEAGALKRLAAIMARYPTLKPYVQGDPRGASLYILRPGDVPEGSDADSYYSRGIAVYK
jgi:hypothetical protein